MRPEGVGLALPGRSEPAMRSGYLGGLPYPMTSTTAAGALERRATSGPTPRASLTVEKCQPQGHKGGNGEDLRINESGQAKAFEVLGPRTIGVVESPSSPCSQCSLTIGGAYRSTTRDPTGALHRGNPTGFDDRALITTGRST